MIPVCSRLTTAVGIASAVQSVTYSIDYWGSLWHDHGQCCDKEAVVTQFIILRETRPYHSWDTYKTLNNKQIY